MTLQIQDAVRDALVAGQAVVALESTVIAHGLPYPHNLQTAKALEDAVRAGGATPATIGVVRGTPAIGLPAEALERFGQGTGVLKLSRRDLAMAIARREDGATTVAATMTLAAAAGIAVFATGGIGGVHRGARESWDVSSDLTELSRTPVLVVCAGAKAILDLPATLEVLETLGVPVVGYGTDEFPAFYSRTSGLRLTSRADSPAEVAAMWAAHRQYGGGGGMLVCAPVPADDAMPTDVVETAIAQALREAAHVRGAEVTPFLLGALERATGGQSLRTNVALLRNNARIAAEIAGAISTTDDRRPTTA